MKTPRVGALLLALAAAGLLAVQLRGETRKSSTLGKAADNRIYAQQLVNELMAAHPELVVVGFHTIAPGASEQTMIATNLDRVGKPDDEDDIAVVKERKTILMPNAKEPNKFEVQLTMIDLRGEIIGAYGLVFRYRAGDDEVELLRKARAIRAELAAKIPNHAALFKPMR